MKDRIYTVQSVFHGALVTHVAVNKVDVGAKIGGLASWMYARFQVVEYAHFVAVSQQGVGNV